MHPKVTVRIVEEKIFFGPGIAQLLNHVVSTGSVKSAAKEMGLSYTKAFKILNEADIQLGFPLLERYHGGKSGGQAILTVAGKEFLEKYLSYEREVQEYAKKRFLEVFPAEEKSVDTVDGD